MRKILIILVFIIISSLEVFGQQDELKSVFQEKLITINSASNATLLGGKTREIVEFDVPQNAKSWTWQIRVVKRGSPLGTARKSLIQIATNNYAPGVGIIAANFLNDVVDTGLDIYKNCDIYLIQAKEDAQQFIQQGNWNFRYSKVWKDIGGGKDIVNDVKGKIYLGFINTNNTIGLDVYLDVLIEFLPKQQVNNNNIERNFSKPDSFLTGVFTDAGIAYAWFVNENGKFIYGYVDTSGQVMLPFEFEQAFPFFNGQALVKKNGKLFYINQNGQKVKDYVQE